MPKEEFSVIFTDVVYKHKVTYKSPRPSPRWDKRCMHSRVFLMANRKTTVIISWVS